MFVNIRATALLLLACVGPTAFAEASAWGALEGTWNKLPIACGRNLESTCGGDRFTLNAGLLDARKTCAGVHLVVRDHTEDTWHVDVVGRKACTWNSRRVRSFVFTLEPGGQRLRLVAYSGSSAVPDEELFRGYGFERD
jgi:hypothetical protein